VYTDAAGRPSRDPGDLDRIRRLAIPPAYEDVWICADPRGHLQATGRDARGRKQYRYHPAWRVVRDGTKFERMAEFGAMLPLLRRRLRKDLAAPGHTRPKVLAAILGLLDATGLRVGNDEYARENGSFGITTLRNRHVRFEGNGTLRFRFRGKGGIEHDVGVADRRLAAIVRRCHELPGQRLFQYIDESGEARAIDSGQVNDYLRAITGRTFTAKDFRTWTATRFAVELLCGITIPPDLSEGAAKSCIAGVVRQVAQALRNTPAVCRKSYINPVVFEAWRQGRLEKTLARARDAEAVTLALLGAAVRVKRVRNKGTPKVRRPRRRAAQTGESRSRPGSTP
jgi:DNA topoisomerase IB